MNSPEYWITAHVWCLKQGIHYNAEIGFDPNKFFGDRPLGYFRLTLLIFAFGGLVAAQDKPPLPAPVESSPGGGSAKQAVEDGARLEKSLLAWAKAKDDCGGNYSYRVPFTSAFGFGHTTIVVVRANKVVERKFERFGRPEPGRPGTELKPEWVETGKEIGNHRDPSSAPAKTLDELYADAKKVLEAKLAPREVRSLALDTRGLLQACFIRDTGIAGDAPMNGIPFIQLTLGIR